MESFSGCGFSVGGCFVRKKRSVVSHKPRLDPLTFSERSKILLPVVNSFGKESLSKKHDSKDKVLYSDGLQSEKRPKKLKLKLRGVTHTIQSKYAADSIVCGDSPIPTSSCPSDDFTPQLKPLQDVKTFCSSDGGKCVGVKRKYSLNFSSSSRKEYSSKGQISGESVPEDGEPARKSKRIQKRRVSDVGLSEDGNEDDEIQFLERLNASKVAVPKRGKMDGDHGGDIENSKLQRLRKHSGKKSRSEKMCEDRDYLGEEDDEELISDDELESNGKTLKRGSLSLLLEEPQKSTPTTRNRALQSGVDILNGSGSNDINLANHLLPASSRKKEKISEVDKQSKKAEAAQRRKIQTEKIAREAEAEAIRKILGQDSKKKKREEELKQKRDELSEGRKTSAVTLAPNTVRWVNGPNGTVVTFSDDIGLPNIFSPALCSYPPPREKCAGPNCTNAYKYRDSKSKLPLCSLHCYRALNGKTERLIAC